MSLSNFWLGANRKDLAERALIAKREQQIQQTQRCESAAKYHRDLNLLSSQYKNLEDTVSGKVPRVNKESRTEEELQSKKREKLLFRQQQLKLLFAEESEKYLAELKQLTGEEQSKDPWNLTQLKEQVEELKKNRLENEELLRKSSRYQQQHMSNIPYIKEHEEKLSEKDVLNAWNQQKKQITEEVEKKSAEDLYKRNELEDLRQKTLLEEEAAKAERLDGLKKWEKEIREQVLRLETNRAESDKLNFQVEVLNEYDSAVDEVSANCNKIEAIQKQRIEKIVAYRPSKEKVKRMASEVINCLDVDLKSLVVLESLLDKQHENLVHVKLDRIKAAKETIQIQLEREKSSVVDMQCLYEEELKQLWTEKTRVWDKGLAQQRQLMVEIFQSLKAEIQQKRKNCLTEENRLLVEQEQLLQKLKEFKAKANEDADNLWQKEAYFTEKLAELDRKLKKLETSKK